MAHLSDYDWRKVSEFLESFPTYRLHSETQSFEGLWVFSKDEQGSQNYYNSSSSSDDLETHMIHEKIQYVFSKMKSRCGMIFQLWVPVTIEGGRRILSTFGQPFAVSYPYDNFKNYRRRSLEYGYNIDVNNNNNNNNNNNMIIGGPPASAFLNRLTELVVLNESVHQDWGPLVRYGFVEDKLGICYMMPIYCPSQNSSSSDCIGVIECSSTFSDYTIQIINQMSGVLEEVGLDIFNVQDRIPYKTINGLKPARDEIQDALKIVCESHHINLAQVWISYEDEIHLPFSSSLKNLQTKRPLGLKLSGYTIDMDSIGYDWIYEDYHDVCDILPLQEGNGLVFKTLQDYEPRLCKQIYKPGTNMLLGWASLFVDFKGTGVAICLRSIDTGDFDYAFEFMWKDNSNYVILLEDLLLTLKRCLPHFKFASGVEHSDGVLVIDVDNSTKSEIKKFKIFQGKRLSPIHEALEIGNKQMVLDYLPPMETICKTAPIIQPQQVIQLQYGTATMKQAAENLLVSLSGARDEVHVMDVENSTENETTNFKIFQENRLSLVPEAMEKGKKAIVVDNKAHCKAKRDTTQIQLSREDIEQHYGKTMKEAAHLLRVSLSTLKRKCNGFKMLGWQGPELSKRRTNNSYNSQSKQSYTNEKDNGAIQDPLSINRNENTVTIKAEYADDIIKLHLRMSEATFTTVEDEIGKKFKLNLGTYKLKYLDEDDEWILMTSDLDMSDCLKISRNVERTVVRLRVLLQNR